MWYKLAKQKFNTFGLPISGKSRIKSFADEELLQEEIAPEEVEDTTEEQLDDNGIVIPSIDAQPENEVTIDDPTNDGEFSPEDLQTNIKNLEEDVNQFIVTQVILLMINRYLLKSKNKLLFHLIKKISIHLFLY
jgi:hypothetical protein